MICAFCNEELDGTDTSPWPIHVGATAEPVHRQCLLRSSIGGIGHLLAHNYWCKKMDDPDAGLTYRQSALMVEHWVHVVGIEDAVTPRE